MDYSGIFTYMYTETALAGVIVATLLYDLIAGSRGRRFFHAFVRILMLAFIEGPGWPYSRSEAGIIGRE